MPRKPTGRTGVVVHAYCPVDLYERLDSFMVSRAMAESATINRAIEIALPILEKEVEVAGPFKRADFLQARERKRKKAPRSTLLIPKPGV